MNQILLTFETNLKINLIKMLREMTGWGLKEAKDAVEQGIILNPNQMYRFLADLSNQVYQWNNRPDIAPGSAVLEVKTNVVVWNPKPSPVPLPGYEW